MEALSTALATLATDLTTESGHDWALGTPFDPLETGIRQGRIFVNYHSIPEALEDSVVYVTVEFQTRLLAADDADRVGNIDYSIELNRHIQRAAYNRIELEPVNGDRHGALLNSAWQNIDSRPDDINEVSTTHFYQIQFDVEPLRLPLA
ncbi:MAG: hypothetical protein AAF773_00745 [Cyanobacteria bacterium P01_D01_bin.115]